MYLLFLVGYLIYKNSVLAKAKAKNMFVWGGLTFIAVFLAMMVGMYMIVGFFYPGVLKTNDVKVAQDLADAVGKNFLQSFFLLFCGFGGYLLIRYILEQGRGPVQTKPEVEAEE